VNTRTAVMSAHVSASAHCSGFLEKKSPKLFKSWQERWFVMSEVRVFGCRARVGWGFHHAFCRVN
jgi:hypothetical protein